MHDFFSCRPHGPAHNFARYLEITKDNIGHGSGAVIRYFVQGGDQQKSLHSGTGDVSTSELDLVGSAVLHGCIFGPTKNPRGSFKHCIRIDFAKEFQPALKTPSEIFEHESTFQSESARCPHRTPQKLVLCFVSETEKKEWLQALTDAMAMTESEQATTTILLSALSRNAGKQFEQAVAKLVSSDPGDDRIRELLSDILTQLMGPNAVTQNLELVRDGLNCIGTLVERMPNKMRSRAALNMFIPATITQTDSSSAMVSQAALQVLAVTVRCCKEYVLPFFYGIFQSILRHIGSHDKAIRSKAHSVNDSLMKLTEIKNAKELWQKTLDKHLELILTAVCDSERDHHAVTGLSRHRERRPQDFSHTGSIHNASASHEILSAGAASKLMLEFRFYWLELLLDKEKLDFYELGGSPMLPHAVVTLLDAACIGELRERAQLAAQIAKSMYVSIQSKRTFFSISATDTELAQVLVSKTTPDHPFFVRNLAFMFVANFFQMHAAAAFPYYASFVKNVLSSLPHNDGVPCARSVHEQMLKLVRGPPLLGAESSRDLLALIHAVTSHLDSCSHLECSDTLQWIIAFNLFYPSIFLDCMDTFLPPFMRLLVNCDGRNRLSGPESSSHSSNSSELRGCMPIAIELFSSLAHQHDSCFKLVEVLVDCLAQLSSDALLQTTREVVGNLFSVKQPGINCLSPLQLFTQICVQLQLKKSEQHFCHLMSHSLVSLLFVKPELHSLRDLLSDIEASAVSVDFFDTCFKGLSSNPVALIALCFYSRFYTLAASVIHSFADWELNISFETEVQYVVRLLQGPTMQSVRYDLHGGSGLECSYQAWWALNALLAIMYDVPISLTLNLIFSALILTFCRPEMCEHFAPLKVSP